MKRSLLYLTGLVLATAAIDGANQAVAQTPQADYELWVLDQSDTRPDGGGMLYIYPGSELSGANPGGAKPEVIDLGAAARDFCLTQTGSAPRRPRMMAFNPSHTHAIISFVATGHVLFLNAATRTPVACIDVGVQAHAAFASPDQEYVMVANQNGKLLQRIRTDYATNTFLLENDATLDLASGTTPSGAPREEATLRPDNAPIWPHIDSTSRFTFLTLHGGGLFVAVDAHGAVSTGGGRYLWVADRAANRLMAVDTQDDHVIQEIALVGSVSNDPAPDLLDISPNGSLVFVSLRGPKPLTGNDPAVNNAAGSTPGVGVIRVEDEGRTGTLQVVIPIANVVSGVETADPHGIRLRRK